MTWGLLFWLGLAVWALLPLWPTKPEKMAWRAKREALEGVRLEVPRPEGR